MMVATKVEAQGVIDVHSHIITPEFLSALEHLKTDHFLRYKQGTLHMVKSLKLPTMQPLDPEAMKLIFKKQH